MPYKVFCRKFVLQRIRLFFVYSVLCSSGFGFLWWIGITYNSVERKQVYISQFDENLAFSLIIKDENKSLEARTGKTTSQPRYTSTQHLPTPTSVHVSYTHIMRSTDNRTIFNDIYGTRDTRSMCDSRNYGSFDAWPRATVIITFVDNELMADLLHTIHSVIQHSPAALLKEILLIDDNSSKDDFKESLAIYCRAIFGDIVQIHRSNTSLGLIQARLWGSRLATGEAIVMLDAHMEVQKRWLEALLYEIRRERRIMATISMDWMRPSESGVGWTYTYGPGSFVCHYDWDLTFGYSWPSYKWSAEYNNDSTIPLPSPCSVGNWAMDLAFFREIGELDGGMKMWGGENLELAIRAWLFGGRAVQIPCSHAAHMERPHQRDYRNGWDSIRDTNYKRLVEVWFDDYKKYFYHVNPNIQSLDMGDIRARLELKKKAKYDFGWYLKNVYPALGMFDVDSFAFGQLRNLYHRGCVVSQGAHSEMSLAACTNPKYVVYWSNEAFLRNGAFLVTHNTGQGQKSLTYEEFITKYDQPDPVRWIHWKNGPLKIAGLGGLCMAFNEVSNALQMTFCDPCDMRQRWRWDIYTEEFDRMLTDVSILAKRNLKTSIRREIMNMKKVWDVPTISENMGQLINSTNCKRRYSVTPATRRHVLI